MTVVLPVTGSPNWDTPLNTALLDLQSQAQAAQTSANSAITIANGKVIKDSLTYNVKDHGALGNGSTDDTAAIQATINLASANGGIVFLPPGTYNISASLTLTSNVVFTGAGQGATTIQQNSTTSAAITGADLTAVRIQDMRINGPASGTGIGIRLTLSTATSVLNLSVVDVLVSSFGSDGINVAVPLACRFNRVTVRNCGGYGFNLVGVNFPTSNAVSLQSCYSLSNATGGFHLFRMVGTVLNGCTVSTSTSGIGYNIDTCSGVTMVGSAAISCGTGVQINAGQGNALVGYLNHDNRNTAVLLTGNTLDASIENATELTPNGSAVRFIQTNAGTNATLTLVNNITANLYNGTVNILDDSTSNILAGGDVRIATVGKTLFVKEGTNAKMGTSSLVAGSVVVNTTAVTASSRIFLTPQNTSGTAGAVSVSARTAGTSFTMTSTSSSDTRSIAWLIIEPA